MKKFKRIMALVIALAMVLSMGAMSAFADGEAPDPNVPNTYTITITNTNTSVSIKDQSFTAYKLFESRYVDDKTLEDDTTPYGLDQGPHSYYILKGNPFFDYTSAADGGNAYVTKSEVNGVTTYTQVENPYTSDPDKKNWQDNADASPLYQLLNYFVLTEMPGEAGKEYDDQFVLVEPITTTENDEEVSTFTAEKAYELSQAMSPIIATKASELAPWSATGTTPVEGDNEKAKIDVSTLGAGYYLVTGGGIAYKEGDTEGAATGDTVTAAVALTTTDPAAEIIAKLDAPKVVKTINETGTPKYNNKGVGDTVPYVVTTDVPNMTGYEKYFFIMNDTLSKGLTLNDNNNTSLPNVNYTDENQDVVDNGFEVRITFPEGTSYTNAQVPGIVTPATGNQYVILQRVADHAAAVTAQGTGDDATNTAGNMTYYVEGPDGNNEFEVVFHNMIQYKGGLIVDSGDVAEAQWSPYDYRKVAGNDKSKVGTTYSPYDGATITIKYSATVNENAVIGTTGNINTAKLEYSNKPDKVNNGQPGDEDKPGFEEGDDKVTEESPESKTVTYVTGLKVLKYTKDASDSSKKNPLANAEFTLQGTNLKSLVKKSSVIYRALKEGETLPGNGTKVLYKLTNGNYTTDAPTADQLDNTNPNYPKITYGTWREYEGFSTDGLTATTITLPKNADDTSTAVTKTLYLNQNDINTAANNLTKYVEDTIESSSYVRFRKAITEEDTDTSKYYRLESDGRFVADATAVTEPTGNQVQAYVEITPATKTWEEMTMAEKEAATVTQTVKTDENGLLQFIGLQATGDDGLYTLTEIAAPDGYNLLKQPIEIKITWTPAKQQTNTNVQDNDACTWEIQYRNKGETEWSEAIEATDAITGLFQLDVENLSGVELPSTGGIGTTIFYVVGAILVIGAGVVLITRRRMDA